MRNKIQEATIDYLKKRWWYVILLLISSVYIFYYRKEIGDLSRLDARHLIFILWLLLLLYPLFSEIEIGSVKLKKEIEEAKETAKEAFRELRLQILDMKISNSNANSNANSNTFVLNSPLPSEQELRELRENIKPNKETDKELKLLEKEIHIPEQNIYLFKVRLTIEKRIRALCVKMEYDVGRGLMTMVRYLLTHEVIDSNMADAIEQIIHISNRGVHGEIISTKYIDFVNEVVPDILNQFDEIEKKYPFFSKRDYYNGNNYKTSMDYDLSYEKRYDDRIHN